MKIIRLLLESKSETAVANILGQTSRIKRLFKHVKGVSPDKPTHLRRLNGRDNTPQTKQCDPKLNKDPRVALTRLDNPPFKAVEDNSTKGTTDNCPLAHSSPNNSICEPDSEEQVTVISAKPVTKVAPRKRKKHQLKKAQRVPRLQLQKRGLLGPPPPLLPLSFHPSSQPITPSREGGKPLSTIRDTYAQKVRKPAPFHHLPPATRPPDTRVKGRERKLPQAKKKLQTLPTLSDPLLLLPSLKSLLEKLLDASPQTASACLTRS